MNETQIADLVCRQIQNLFGCDEEERSVIERSVPDVLSATERCFAEISNKYYEKNGGRLNPFHSGQYLIFLYFLSRRVWEACGSSQLADKVYYLNKALNGCDLLYEIQLPSVFFVEHPVGSVIGRGCFSDFFVFQQSCTVGGNKGAYPKLGKFVWLFSQAMVVGSSVLGNNVFVSAGTYIKDAVIPDNCVVFGRSPNLIIKEKPASFFYEKSPFFVHHQV